MEPLYVPLFVIAAVVVAIWVFVGVAFYSMLQGKINSDGVAIWVVAAMAITALAGIGMYDIAEAINK